MLNIALAPLQDGQGQTGALVVLEDVTARISLEDGLALTLRASALPGFEASTFLRSRSDCGVTSSSTMATGQRWRRAAAILVSSASSKSSGASGASGGASGRCIVDDATPSPLDPRGSKQSFVPDAQFRAIGFSI